MGFYFLFLVAVPAYVQIDRGIYPFYARYTVAQLATGLVVVALAHGALIAGQAMSGSVRRTGAMARTQPCNGNPASVRLSRNFAAVMLAASVLLAVYVGPETLFLNRSERGGLEQQGIDIQLLYIGRSTSLVALCVCVLMLRRAGSGQRVRGVVELSILAVPTFLVLNFPQGLSRFQLLGSALAIAVLCTSVFRTSRKAAFALGAPFFLFIFFPLIKAIGTGGEVDLSDAMSRDIGAYLLRVDFDSFKQIVDTTIYADTGPLRLGMNFLGALLFWVPRSLWQSKPVDSGEIVSTSLGYPFTNVSSPLPAEALISFGLVGVLVVFLLVGMAVSSIERSAMLVERVGGHELILYAITTGFVTIILRGPSTESRRSSVRVLSPTVDLPTWPAAGVDPTGEERRGGPLEASARSLPSNPVQRPSETLPHDSRLHDPGRTEGGDVISPSSAACQTGDFDASRRERLLRGPRFRQPTVDPFSREGREPDQARHQAARQSVSQRHSGAHLFDPPLCTLHRCSPGAGQSCRLGLLPPCSAWTHQGGGTRQGNPPGSGRPP
nr:hypothetical protein [Nocardioides aquaticus]